MYIYLTEKGTSSMVLCLCVLKKNRNLEQKNCLERSRKEWNVAKSDCPFFVF